MQSLKQKQKLIDAFDFSQSAWIVADLNSKASLQEKLLEKHVCLPEDAVLRINELWKKLLRSEFSEFDIVSTDYISILLTEWLNQKKQSWVKHPGTARTLLNYIASLLPVIANANSQALVRDWLRSQPEALLRWGLWYELAIEAWSYFNEKKILAPKWVAPFLNSRDIQFSFWTRDLIIDVGPELTVAEVELFRKLKNKFNITVCAPREEEIAEYETGLWPYRLISFDQTIGTEKNHTAKNKAAILNRRYTSPMAEVKAATAQVRKWLDSGVHESGIAVVANEIEKYWPYLSAYFEREGLLAAKDHVVSAISFPAVSRWLSRLKIESGEVESADLEQNVYKDSEPPPLNYEKFKQLFNQLYDKRDLERELSVQKIFAFKYTANEVMPRDQFFAWALQFWEGETKPLEAFSAVFLAECPQATELKVKSWLQYTSNLISKLEIKVKAGAAHGISILNLEMAQNQEFTHVIVLGLSDNSQSNSDEISISRRDVEKLITDLDLYIENREPDTEAYLIYKITQQTINTVGLYFSATDFSGQVQSPSLFWLKKNLEQGSNLDIMNAPEPTRWDEIQSNPESFVDPEVVQNFKIDMGLAESEKSKFSSEIRYSPSQLEKYLRCPFIFLSEKMLHLSQLPDVDLDVDAMTSGRILHGCLDRLLSTGLRKYQDGELEKTVDEVRTQVNAPIADLRLWQHKRRQYVSMLKEFIEFEIDWRKNHPQTRTVAREIAVRGDMQLTEGISIPVSGQIDRVDTDGKNYVIIDYKTSGYNLRNHGAWINNSTLQLMFYAIAIEQGLSSLPTQTVAAAVYYTLTKINRDKGFKRKDLPQNLFSIHNREKSAITSEKYSSLSEEVKKVIKEAVSKIQRGELSPAPSDFHFCDDCQWRTLCRAPHLN